MNEVLAILGLILLFVGVIAIFDARPLSRREVLNLEQNTKIRIIKSVGLVISIIGAILFYCFYII